MVVDAAAVERDLAYLVRLILDRGFGVSSVCPQFNSDAPVVVVVVAVAALTELWI